MRYLAPEEIPELPIQNIVNGECIAFGVVEPGAIVQYMDRDLCILIEWGDVVMFGFELLKTNRVKQEKEPEEIQKPTVVE